MGKNRWVNQESEYDMSDDILNDEIITQKCRNSESYSQNLYAALCNNVFQKTDVIEILKERKWLMSWRAAGGLVSKIRREGNYMDWYCTGIQDDDRLLPLGYVTESQITDEVREDFKRIGWCKVD